MARRDPFATPEPENSKDPSWDQVLYPEGGHQGEDTNEAEKPPLKKPEPIDFLPLAKKKKRKREWEKKYRAITYRGVSRELNDSLKSVATELQVTLDEVVRAFLECGLTAYHANELRLKPEIKDGKWTLYPSTWGVKTGMRKANPPIPIKPKSVKNKQKNVKSRDWERVRSYRIPDEIHQAVRKLAAELFVPVGNVFCKLTEYAIIEYAAGRLIPNLHPAEHVKMTLTMEK